MQKGWGIFYHNHDINAKVDRVGRRGGGGGGIVGPSTRASCYTTCHACYKVDSVRRGEGEGRRRERGGGGGWGRGLTKC